MQLSPIFEIQILNFDSQLVYLIPQSVGNFKTTVLYMTKFLHTFTGIVVLHVFIGFFITLYLTIEECQYLHTIKDLKSVNLQGVS